MFEDELESPDIRDSSPDEEVLEGVLVLDA